MHKNRNPLIDLFAELQPNSDREILEKQFNIRKFVDRAMHRADRAKVDYSSITFVHKLELTCSRRKIGAWSVGVWQIIRKMESVIWGFNPSCGLVSVIRRFNPSCGASILHMGLQSGGLRRPTPPLDVGLRLPY